jgi:hypothetical protein
MWRKAILIYLGLLFTKKKKLLLNIKVICKFKYYW